MKLIVGLGNPGKEYENTRHNIGFKIIDAYVNDNNWQEKFHALYIKKIISEETVYFLKPLTYMNLSGQAVGEIVRYFNVDIDDILVIQDDLDLGMGNYKLKKHSSSGGHNGIKSIMEFLSSDGFARLKVGIKTSNKKDAKDFVLGKFMKEEIDTLNKLQPTFNEIITSFINYGIEKTMNIYNTK